MKKFYKITVAIFAIILIAVCANAAEEFVGSKTSNKYHDPTCKWVKEIKPYKIVKFNSPEEAIKAGYIPCPACRPPLPAPDKTATDKSIKESHKIIPERTTHKSYTLNIVLSFLFLILLLIVPFLPGFFEIIIGKDSFEGISKKESSP